MNLLSDASPDARHTAWSAVGTLGDPYLPGACEEGALGRGAWPVFGELLGLIGTAYVKPCKNYYMVTQRMSRAAINKALHTYQLLYLLLCLRAGL